MHPLFVASIFPSYEYDFDMSVSTESFRTSYCYLSNTKYNRSYDKGSVFGCILCYSIRKFDLAYSRRYMKKISTFYTFIVAMRLYNETKELFQCLPNQLPKAGIEEAPP